MSSIRNNNVPLFFFFDEIVNVPMIEEFCFSRGFGLFKVDGLELEIIGS